MLQIVSSHRALARSCLQIIHQVILRLLHCSHGWSRCLGRQFLRRSPLLATARIHLYLYEPEIDESFFRSKQADPLLDNHLGKISLVKNLFH